MIYGGARVCYSYMYEVPFLFLTIIRSSNTLIYTLVAMLTSKFTSVSVNLKGNDYLKGVLITLGVILFSIGKSREAAKTTISFSAISICVASMFFEAMGGVLLQCLKNKYPIATGEDVMTVSTLHNAIWASIHGRMYLISRIEW